MKAETSETPRRETDTTVTPETPSVGGQPESPAWEGEDTAASSTLTADTNPTTGKSKDVDGLKPESAEKPANLVGRINNMVTTDLETIVEGREFLSTGEPPFVLVCWMMLNIF